MLSVDHKIPLKPKWERKPQEEHIKEQQLKYKLKEGLLTVFNAVEKN